MQVHCLKKKRERREGGRRGGEIKERMEGRRMEEGREREKEGGKRN